MTKTNKSPREVMVEAAQELETQAELGRIQRDSNPLMPAEEPVEEERIPTHEIPPEHRVPPQQVIEEEKLGAK